MPQDSVLLSIKYIRVANLLLVERDRLSAELENCKELSSITNVVIKIDSVLVYELEGKIANLDYIINTKDKINKLEVYKLNKVIKQYKKKNVMILGGSGIILLLLILL